MAPPEPRWTLSRGQVSSLLMLLCLHTATGMSGWGGCLDGENVFGKVRENAPRGEVVAELAADTTAEGVHWTLDGKDAKWFSLDKRRIRLNAPADEVLDRETAGPVLVAELLCYEDDTHLQSVYRVVVEVLNENDNSPAFAENTTRPLSVSELTPVNTVIFTVRAVDADNDQLFYSVDQTSPDAEYFKVDLPNSGEVILAKPLDYETKAVLSVTIHASEMNTAEHYNTSTNITINVLDGDDQYPQFLPCVLLFQDDTRRICTSPVYTANVTEGEEDIVLDFSPGPIHAVDGDSGLSAPLSYAILSGDDDGRFLMDRETGEMRLIRRVRDRLTTSAFNLHVVAYQDDDPRKYSVASVLVRILAVNRFYPEFDVAEYHGFVTAGMSPASLVSTYGGKVLMLHVQDQDFELGFNSMISFTFSQTSNHTDIYQLTQEGLLIARTALLKPKQKHTVEVKAIDQESGDATFTTVVIEVLPAGQSVPHSALADDSLTGCIVGKALTLSAVFMTALGCVVYTVMWLKKRYREMRDPLERGCVAQGKHPNVSLRWFQLASHRGAMPHMEEVPFERETLGTCNPSFTCPDDPGIYTHQHLPSGGHAPPGATAAPATSLAPTESVCSPVIFSNNVSAPAKTSSSPPTYHPTTADVTPTHATTKENLDSLTDLEPGGTTPKPNPSPQIPFTCSGLQTMRPTNDNDPVDPVTGPPAQSAAPISHSQTASAETDNPFSKPCVKTPPYSPLLSTQASTPPPTPEQAPLKARLIHVDTLPFDTAPAATGASGEADQPSTSLDEINQSEHRGTDDSSPSHSGNSLDGHTAGDEEDDDDGILGNEDSENSGGEGTESNGLDDGA